MNGDVLGLYLSLASTLCASSMGFCAKLAGSRGVPVFEIVLARSLILMALTLPQLAQKGINPLRCERKLMLLLRGLLGFGAVSTMYWAVQYLALADAAVLMFLAPVFVAVLAPLLLKELPSRGVYMALPLSLMGVVLVSQPAFIFRRSQVVSGIGAALGLSQAMFSACAKMCVRALGSTEPVQTIVAGMAAVSICGASILCASLPNHFVIPGDALTWLLLLGTGMLGFGNQVLITTSLKLSNAAASVAMSYVGVLWSIGADLILFKDGPGPLSLTGATLVCASSFFVVRSEQQRSSEGEGKEGRGGGHAAQPGGQEGGGRRGTRIVGGIEEEAVQLIEAGKSSLGISASWAAGDHSSHPGHQQGSIGSTSCDGACSLGTGCCSQPANMPLSSIAIA